MTSNFWKLPIKDYLPDKEERKQRENEIAKQEENAKLADLIELVNEYDYTEEDLKKIENQVMLSFNYLEILSKTLPAFCQNMKADQQDRLVELIYRCPNQFLYTILKDIGENFDEFTNNLYSEISILRKERKLDKKLENNLSKSIIRFTVRDYFLRNSNMDLHGEAQSLMDQFFAGSTRKDIQMNMAKKRLSDKDRT